MRILSAIFAVCFAATGAFSIVRMKQCGYDCGIFPNETSGSGPAVIVVFVLSGAGLLTSVVVLLIAIAVDLWKSRPPF